MRPVHPSMSTHLYVILPHLSDCPSSSDHLSAIFISPSDCLSLPNRLYDNTPSPSACMSPSGSQPKTLTHPTAHLSSNMIQHMQDSSQSLAVMNGEQSRKAKKFCRAFTNYDLLLQALDVSCIYLSVS